MISPAFRAHAFDPVRLMDVLYSASTLSNFTNTPNLYCVSCDADTADGLDEEVSADEDEAEVPAVAEAADGLDV